VPSLTRADAAHLVRRTGFGVTSARLKPLVGLERREAVARVLDVSKNPTAVSPAHLGDPSLSEYEKWYRTVWWWLDRMRRVPSPIEEKMTLFWHGHFVSSENKLFDMALLQRQNQLYRRHALGSHVRLTKAMAVEPAMLLYLDNAFNRRSGVQENFGRELLELFTLGRGNYTERDVRAMSRAWTGHGLNSAMRSYRYHRDQHDHGTKTLFGVSRNWNGPAAIEEILRGKKAIPASRFITAKLFSYFAYPVTPADPVVGRLAERFRASGLSIKALVRSILVHDAFWGPTARRALVRQPVEYFVAALEALGLTPAETHPEWFMEGAGQMLYWPPNVDGWGQNAYWISSAAMWARAGFASSIRWQAYDKGVFEDFYKLAPRDAVDRAFTRFGVVDPAPETRAALESFHDRTRKTYDAWSISPGLIQGVLMSPDFQVA
jgi:uncharacterized protein (DUF1800 family)